MKRGIGTACLDPSSPVRYDLTFTPDLEAATYTGSEDVAVIVEQPVDRVVMNAIDLAIDAARMTYHDGTVLEMGSVAYDEELQRATLAFERRSWRGVDTAHRVPRHHQRQAPWLLPLHVHG